MKYLLFMPFSYCFLTAYKLPALLCSPDSISYVVLIITPSPCAGLRERSLLRQRTPLIPQEKDRNLFLKGILRNASKKRCVWMTLFI